MTDTNPSAIGPEAGEAPVDESHIIAERRAKLARLREAGPAFPNDFRPQHQAAALHAAHGHTSAEDLEATAVPACIAGRMMLKRVMGKAAFGTLQDGSSRMQIYVQLDAVGADALEAF